MFLHVFKHFEDFQEDQFDFHTYCLRKMTLRAYVEMLRMEDELYHHVYYSKAAWGAIEAYLLLLDQPDKDAKVGHCCGEKRGGGGGKVAWRGGKRGGGKELRQRWLSVLLGMCCVML